MTQRFIGRVALVTGAASGIGQATALLFAAQGANVVAADIDEAGLAATVARCKAEAIAQPLDVTREDHWDAAIARTMQRWGRLDILVNCAGITIVRPVIDMTLDEWRRVMAVNLDGVFLGTRAGVRAMRKDGGSIVNISSVSGIRATPAGSSYCASKAAVILFTKSAAMECVQAGEPVRVNVVAPGGVKTPIWGKDAAVAPVMESDIWNAPDDAPIGKRFATVDEIARVIAFLASDEASYITGAVLPVDAGYSA